MENTEDLSTIKSLHLLTNKPILYVANLSENEIVNNIENKYVKRLDDYAKSKGGHSFGFVLLSNKRFHHCHLKRKKLFKEYNLNESGLNKMVRASFDLLGLQTFFTGGPTEVRSWTIPIGATAKQSAGVIHSDFERGFIKAEVFGYNDLVKHGSRKTLYDLGLARTEGKEYIVKEGDCIFFKFNV